MERLTEKIGNTNCVKGCGSNCKYGFQYCTKEDWENCKTIADVIDKLAEYEDLEEQGLLLRLPCKIGDKVYLICSRYSECSKYKERFDEYNCQGCEDECDSRKEYYTHINHSVSIEWIVRNLNNFGKTVFLTQAEAEQKLKEMESDYNDKN